MLWTEDEIKIIYDAINEGKKAVDIVDKLPGRNVNAISVKMSRLKGREKRKSGWTHEEREILKKYYKECTTEELLEKLPGRTAGSIRGQVSYLRARGWSI